MIPEWFFNEKLKIVCKGTRIFRSITDNVHCQAVSINKHQFK